MRGRNIGCIHMMCRYGSGSGQQSVTGFPNVDDANSYWASARDKMLNKVTPLRVGQLDSGVIKTWKQDQRIRLQHVDTQGYLHSHDKKYQRIAGGQQEGYVLSEKKRADNVWAGSSKAHTSILLQASKHTLVRRYCVKTWNLGFEIGGGLVPVFGLAVENSVSWDLMLLLPLLESFATAGLKGILRAFEQDLWEMNYYVDIMTIV
ncbi:hypothetical protein NC651_037821 [Populus alba x Populus x berolinensis]|nr:hypothetical protein NC651_037821 [Populus alba x Populus x berolinensis]